MLSLFFSSVGAMLEMCCPHHGSWWQLQFSHHLWDFCVLFQFAQSRDLPRHAPSSTLHYLYIISNTATFLGYKLHNFNWMQPSIYEFPLLSCANQSPGSVLFIRGRALFAAGAQWVRGCAPHCWNSLSPTPAPSWGL